MSIYISGSSGCAGELRGIFSGSLPVHPTASYYNNGGGTTTCTGSIIVSNYVSGSKTFQRVHAYLGSGSETEWTELGGQPATYHVDNYTGGITAVMNSVTHRPGTTIFVDASRRNTSAHHISFTLPPAVPTRPGGVPAGTEYTFICTGNAGSAVAFGITGSSAYGRINSTVACNDAVSNESLRVAISFVVNQFKKGTTLRCISDGDNWYISGVAKCDNDKIVGE
jgi:hypothetical protein